MLCNKIKKVTILDDWLSTLKVKNRHIIITNDN